MYWPFKKKNRLSRAEALAAHPVRNSNVEWKDTDAGEVLITIRPRELGRAKILEWFFPRPPVRQISLDEVGSEVWRLCDGGHTVEKIVKRLAQRYKLNRQEAEISTTEYLRRLGKKRLVGFAIESGTEANSARESGCRAR